MQTINIREYGWVNDATMTEMVEEIFILVLKINNGLR